MGDDFVDDLGWNFTLSRHAAYSVRSGRVSHASVRRERKSQVKGCKSTHGQRRLSAYMCGNIPSGCSTVANTALSRS